MSWWASSNQAPALRAKAEVSEEGILKTAQLLPEYPACWRNVRKVGG